MTSATFFAAPEAFREWLLAHAVHCPELLVGFHKVASGRPCMTWSEAVDEALCFGWIDGVRRRIDEHTYSIRFTPRKPSSIWSAVNIAKMEQLQAAGRSRPVCRPLRTARRTGLRSIRTSERRLPSCRRRSCGSFSDTKRRGSFLRPRRRATKKPCCTGSLRQNGLKRRQPGWPGLWRPAWRASGWICGPSGHRLRRRLLWGRSARALHQPDGPGALPCLA